MPEPPPEPLPLPSPVEIVPVPLPLAPADLLIVPEPPHAASVSKLATAAATMVLRNTSRPMFLVSMSALGILF
ncbi:hypothetical protein BRPE64_DCDS03020 (plasmid) [Caballeronia insecticola]|uniref:Uncharacterized protein n=1 Tax=Caballeronia insecticola TaxID=758793 RepID=R4WRI0_9BURK|nr:hypothetical protein BRPE64_DCDS03020 [Caballeronia insecticola]